MLQRRSSILRGIPDKFKEQIVFGLLVNLDRVLINLAAHPDNIAAHDVRSVRYVRDLRVQIGIVIGIDRLAIVRK